MSGNALLFGSRGALGSAIEKVMMQKSFRVLTAGSGPDNAINNHLQVAYQRPQEASNFSPLPSLDVVIWAHGLNCSDVIADFDLEDLERLWQSNVVFIASSLSALLKAGKLLAGSRLVVVSSIWQQESRPGKMSYTISKAALHGLVKSCALDLGERGILMNAVLPGVVDTPMTRANMSSEQIKGIIDQSALRRLAEPSDIASAVAFLADSSNRAITGQFLTVDAGFIGVKHS